MSLRYLAGYITESYNPLKVPNAPTLVGVVLGDSQVTVSFTAPSNVGGAAITSYIAIVQNTSTGVSITATGATSPITVTGLTNGQTYIVKVAAINIYGPGPYSVPSANLTYAPNLFVWGEGTGGALGTGNTSSLSSPTLISSATSWSSVNAGDAFSLATKLNGTLWAWGDNFYGNIGDNTNASRSSPVQVGALTNWSKVFSGRYSSYSIKTDGTLWSWGYNAWGELGLNNSGSNRSSPVQVGALTDWLRVSGGQSFALALKTNNTLWSWGFNNDGALGQNNNIGNDKSSPTQVGALTDWISVGTGRKHGLAVRSSGSIWSWGANGAGQLGQNDRVYRSSPTQIGVLTNWLSVACGNYHSLAIKTDGTLWAWGRNSDGMLGVNDIVYRSSPVQVGSLTNWLVVSGSQSNSYAIKTDGTLWSWGANSAGRLGQNTGTTAARSSPVQVGSLTTWVNVAGFMTNVVATRN